MKTTETSDFRNQLCSEAFSAIASNHALDGLIAKLALGKSLLAHWIDPGPLHRSGLGP